MVAIARFCFAFTKLLAEDSGWYIASISPRVTARAAWALPPYPGTIWQSSLSASQVNAAPLPSPSEGPLALQRHFILVLTACSTVLIGESGPTSHSPGGAPTVAR